MDLFESSLFNSPEVGKLKKIYFDACEEYGSSQLDQLLDIFDGNSSSGALILRGNSKIFHKNKLKDPDFHAIFTTLHTDPFVNIIDLSYNTISAEVCVNIGKCLVKKCFNKTVIFENV